MKVKTSLIIIFFLICFSINHGICQQTADQLYQKGLYEEEINGNLKKAIEIFEMILQKFSENRSYAAKAQLHIAQCKEKLGLKEVIKEYQKVIDNYPEQSDEVIVAKEKIDQLKVVITKTDTEQPNELTITKVDINPDIIGMISPDGKYLVHPDMRTGNLAVTNVKTKETRFLTNNSEKYKNYDYREMACEARWSPDGKQIGYEWVKDGKYEIKIIGLDDLNPATIYSGDIGVKYSFIRNWSPDGQFVLIGLYNNDDSRELILVSVKTGKVRKITKSETIISAPIFSPDGRFLAYGLRTKANQNNPDIYLFNLSTNVESKLIDHPAIDVPICWSLNGKSLVFRSDRSSKMDLWCVPFEDGKITGEPKLVKMDIGRIFPFGLTNDGSLYFSKHKSVRDVYIAEFESNMLKKGTYPQKLNIHYESRNQSPAFSPDGKYIVFVATKPKPHNRTEYLLCVQNLITSEVHEIKPGLISIFEPCWSPDGNSILVWGGVDRKKSQICIIDVKTGKVEKSFEVKIGVNQPAWSSDGNSVYYVLNDVLNDRNPMVSKVIKRNLKTGNEEEVYRLEESFLLRISFSPDSKWIALLIPGMKKRIKLLSLDSGDIREIYSFEETYSTMTLNWTVDGKYLLVPKLISNIDDKRKYELFKIPIQGGHPEGTGLIMPRFNHLRIHPNGSQVAFSSSGSIAEVYVMENFLPK